MEEQEIGIDFENLFDFYTGLFSLSNYPCGTSTIPDGDFLINFILSKPYLTILHLCF